MNADWMTVRHDLYWLGYRAGRRLAEYQPNEDHERSLRFAVKIAGIKGRAFALGELRGYRQAVDQPAPRPAPDDRWKVQR